MELSNRPNEILGPELRASRCCCHEEQVGKLREYQMCQAQVSR